MAKISAARGKFAARRDLTCFFGLPEAHRRNLPTTQNPDSRLSLLYLAGLGGFPDQTNRGAHARRLARAKVTAEIWRQSGQATNRGLLGRTRMNPVMCFTMLLTSQRKVMGKSTLSGYLKILG